MLIKQISNIKAFTLIELIITMTLIGIIASVISLFISGPIIAFNDTVNRSDLVNAAEMALRRMERDIRQAIPNSIRVKASGSVVAIEMLNAVEGVRYRNKGPGGNISKLTLGGADDKFDILGTFQDASLGSNGYRLVVYNTGAFSSNSDNPTPGVNVYSTNSSSGPNPPFNSHVITPPGTTITLSNTGSIGSVVVSPAFQFALESPRRRMYISDGPISYVCDTSTGNIVRYAGYSIVSTQPTSSLVAPLNSANSALLTQHVSACSFLYSAGVTRRTAIVSLAITLSKSGEEVELLQQIHVSNAP